MTAAVFAYAAESSRDLLYLAPLVVLIRAYLKTTHHIQEIYYIGRYVEVHLERRLSGLDWETKLMRFLEDTPYGQRLKRRMGTRGGSVFLILAL